MLRGKSIRVLPFALVQARDMAKCDEVLRKVSPRSPSTALEDVMQMRVFIKVNHMLEKLRQNLDLQY